MDNIFILYRNRLIIEMFLFCKDVKVQHKQNHYHFHHHECTQHKKVKGITLSNTIHYNTNITNSNKTHFKSIQSNTKYSPPSNQHNTSSNKYIQTQSPLQTIHKPINQTKSTSFSYTNHTNIYPTHPNSESSIIVDTSIYSKKSLLTDKKLLMEVIEKKMIYDRYQKWEKFKQELGKQMNTIVSHENMQSQPNTITDCQYVVEQSIIDQHNIADRFTPVTHTLWYQYSSEYIAIQKQSNLLVSLKMINSQHMKQVSQQVNNYNSLPYHPNILLFYYHSIDNGNHILVKQPYTNLIDVHLINRDQLLSDIKQVLVFLQQHGKYSDWIEIQDIRQVCGVYKLANLQRIGDNKKIQIKSNLDRLQEMIG